MVAAVTVPGTLKHLTTSHHAALGEAPAAARLMCQSKP